MDDLGFCVLSTFFQLYQDDGEGIMRESLCASELLLLILDIQKCFRLAIIHVYFCDATKRTSGK